jgi:hypothetical protein
MISGRDLPALPGFYDHYVCRPCSPKARAGLGRGSRNTTACRAEDEVTMTAKDDSADEPLMIECDSHGTRTAAIVCDHLIRPTDMILGFVENTSDPDDLQAWCNDCEQMFLREQALTEAFQEFNGMRVVCVDCYARLKKLHSAQE